MTTQAQPSAAEPIWMAIARKELGVSEYPGAADNPRIQEYFAAAGHGAHEHDSVAWCSAFANWVMKQAGIAGTGKANARSWLDWGRPLLVPEPGCIVVFSRPSAGPLAGHVGFYVRDQGPLACLVLGGNQGNAVRIAAEATGYVLGWRMPTAE